jgi:Papain family cysteine protease
MERPQTVGDLRRLLANFPEALQTINPNLKDSVPLPPMKTGESAPTGAEEAQTLTAEDLVALFRKQTSNPFLAQRRAARDKAQQDQPATAPVDLIVLPGPRPGLLPSPLPTPPSSVDWRQRFGWPWITSIQDQSCRDCWCFASAALLEAMVRIEHCDWFKGSEASIRWGCNADCSSGGTPDAAIPWMISNGLVDEKCEGH